MTLDGTVVNGVVVLDGSPALPDGTRVRVAVPPDEDDDWPADVPPPPDTETREEFLLSLREALEDCRAGRGIPVAQLFADLKREFGVPPADAG